MADIVKRLLRNGMVDIEARDKNDQHVLYEVAKIGDVPYLENVAGPDGFDGAVGNFGHLRQNAL
jgi:hypothetical protein